MCLQGHYFVCAIKKKIKQDETDWYPKCLTRADHELPQLIKFIIQNKLRTDEAGKWFDKNASYCTLQITETKWAQGERGSCDINTLYSVGQENKPRGCSVIPCLVCTFPVKKALQSVRGQGVRDSSYCSTSLMPEHAKGYNLSCSTKWISVVPEQVVINL